MILHLFFQKRKDQMSLITLTVCLNKETITEIYNQNGNRESPCGVVAKVLDCDIVVSEFKLQSCYYVYF